MWVTTLLLERWDAAAAAGVLRSSPADARIQQLDGPLHLLLLFNANHVQRKRPADVRQLQSAAPVAETASFNFTKIRSSEVLCALHISESADGAAPLIEAHVPDTSDALPQHAVLVNVSPLMRGHALVVFDIVQVKPQRLERAYLAYGLGLVQLANDPHFVLGFNSTGAWSSVNHFHLQGFFLNELSAQPLPVLTQRRRELFQYCGADAPVAAFELPDWPMHCYAIGARDRSSASRAVVRSIVHVAWTLVELLQAQNVPHNVLLAHDIETSQPLVIVFPRKLQQENGVTLFPELSGGVGLHFAIAEVAGLVVASSAGVFERFTQDAFVQILSDEVSLTKDTAQRLVTDWRRACCDDAA